MQGANKFQQSNREIIKGHQNTKLSSDFTLMEQPSKAFGSSRSSEQCHGPAIFRKHFAELHSVISTSGMEQLTAKAYSYGLITAEIKDSIFITNGRSAGEKANILLSAIQGQVKIDPNTFDTFVEILRSDIAYQRLADKLVTLK